MYTHLAQGHQITHLMRDTKVPNAARNHLSHKVQARRIPLYRHR